jgi:hypothetical protein
MRYTEAEYIDMGYSMGVLTNGNAIASRYQLLSMMISSERLEDREQIQDWVHQGRLKAVEWWNSLPPYKVPSKKTPTRNDHSSITNHNGVTP